jgi:8-oxo-dGTP pyrophosphatase MutT (NUDIX family)
MILTMQTDFSEFHYGRECSQKVYLSRQIKKRHIMTGNIIDQLRHRLREKLPGERSQLLMAPAGRLQREMTGDPGKAGVLILLFHRGNDLSTVLIKRTEYPGPHSGQISFPGGKSDIGDESGIHTALREAHEETGLDIANIDILGTLTPLYIPVSDLEVLPVVAYTCTMPDFRINAREVEYLIITHLKDLLPGNQKKITKTIIVQDQLIRAPGYLIMKEYVWGATAMIMSEFLEVFSGLAPASDDV